MAWDFAVSEENSRQFAEAARVWLLLAMDPPQLQRVRWFVSDPGLCDCGATAVLRAEVPTAGGRVLTAALCVQCSRGVSAARLIEFMIESDALVNSDTVGEFRRLGEQWLRSGELLPECP